MEQIVITFIIIADLWAIQNLLQTSVPATTKALWTAQVLALPFIGVGIWYFFGPCEEEITGNQ